MIDNGLGFELVPWKPALEEHLGRQVSGAALPGGGVDWSFGRFARGWDRLGWLASVLRPLTTHSYF